MSVGLQFNYPVPMAPQICSLHKTSFAEQCHRVDLFLPLFVARRVSILFACHFGAVCVDCCVLRNLVFTALVIKRSRASTVRTAQKQH